MRKALTFPILLALALLPGDLAGQAPAGADTRPVVSKQIAVGPREAALALEFSDGGRLEVSLREGVATLDGERLGSFEPGGALDAEWRALLGDAVALENGALAAALRDWSAPEDLPGPAAETAAALDRALEQAVTASAPSEAPSAVSDSTRDLLTRILTGSVVNLGLVEEALAGVDSDLRVHVEEDFEVPAGESVSGTVVVLGGRARVAGEIDGDLVVVDGSVELLEGSRITGELRVADARILRSLGEVGGGTVDILDEDRTDVRDLRDRIRAEVEAEVRDDLRGELRRAARAERDGFTFLSPFAAILGGIGGLIQKAFLIVILGVVTAAALAFAGENVEVISEAARRSPGRSAMVGVAGTVLLLPAWILGAVALVVSIVGIPVAIAWIPLFPIAVGVAGLVGYLAVAKNVGEWLADSGYAWTDWISRSNALHTTVAGIIGLMLACIAADVVSMAPFLGFLEALLKVAGALLTFVVVQVGFGAVLLTRGGRKRETWASPLDPDEAWEAAVGTSGISDAGEGEGHV